jgi:uncharacterized delta-60 repeat protein
MKKRLRRVSVLVLLLALPWRLPVPTIYAAPGELDITFDADGIVTTSVGTNGRAIGRAVALQADGKIVAVGHALIGPDSQTYNQDFAVVRYNPDGSLDASFGIGGVVTTAISNGADDVAYSVAVQADGKIVAVGWTLTNPNTSEKDFAVVRYNSDGSLDTTFDGDGIAVTQISGKTDEARSVVLQSDDKIVVAGQGGTGINTDFAVARYNPDGSLDASFDGDGIATTSIGTLDVGESAALQADGKIVVAGVGDVGAFQLDVAVVRYNPDGSLDTTFDGDGIVTTAIGSSTDEARSVALQTDGRIVAAGYRQAGSVADSAVVRYNPDGSLDPTFSGDGIVVTPTDPASFVTDRFDAIAIQENGKIVAAGSVEAGVGGVGKVVRYNPDGSLDNTGNPSWGIGGIVTSDATFLGAIAIQADGNVVVAGSKNFGSGSFPDFRFVVARYLGDEPTPVNRPPVVTTRDITVGADASCSATILPGDVDNGSSDPDSGDTVSLSLDRAGPFGPGSHTVTLTATDTHGASGSSTAVVTVVDQTPPTFTAVPPPVSAGTGGAGSTLAGAVLGDAALGGATVSDACTTAIVTRSGVPAGNFFSVGVTTIDYTATDSGGNTATAVQTVTVIDDTPPVITPLADVAANAAMPSGAVVSFAPQATDNLGLVSLACAPPAGSVFAIGATLVQCTAGDAAGNAAGVSFHVRVRGAPEQMVDLIELAQGTPLPPRIKASLLTAWRIALANPRNIPAVCRSLGAFIALVQSQPPGAIPPARKAQMIGDAARIKAVLGCP